MENDPLLGNVRQYANPAIADLEERLAQLKDQQRQRVNVQVDVPSYAGQPLSTTGQQTVWDDIREELKGMSESQLQILCMDPEYKRLDNNIQALAAQYQMQLLMPYIIQDKEGKKTLEAQLYTIRSKKEAVAKIEAQEREEFLRWKELQAAKNNKSDKKD